MKRLLLAAPFLNLTYSISVRGDDARQSSSEPPPEPEPENGDRAVPKCYCGEDMVWCEDGSDAVKEVDKRYVALGKSYGQDWVAWKCAGCKSPEYLRKYDSKTGDAIPDSGNSARYVCARNHGMTCAHFLCKTCGEENAVSFEVKADKSPQPKLELGQKIGIEFTTRGGILSLKPKPDDWAARNTNLKNYAGIEGLFQITKVRFRPEPTAPGKGQTPDDVEYVQMPDMGTVIEHANAMDKQFPAGLQRTAGGALQKDINVVQDLANLCGTKKKCPLHGAEDIVFTVRKLQKGDRVEMCNFLSTEDRTWNLVQGNLLCLVLYENEEVTFDLKEGERKYESNDGQCVKIAHGQKGVITRVDADNKYQVKLDQNDDYEHQGEIVFDDVSGTDLDRKNQTHADETDKNEWLIELYLHEQKDMSIWPSELRGKEYGTLSIGTKRIKKINNAQYRDNTDIFPDDPEHKFYDPEDDEIKYKFKLPNGKHKYYEPENQKYLTFPDGTECETNEYDPEHKKYVLTVKLDDDDEAYVEADVDFLTLPSPEDESKPQRKPSRPPKPSITVVKPDTPEPVVNNAVWTEVKDIKDNYTSEENQKRTYMVNDRVYYRKKSVEMKGTVIRVDGENLYEILLENGEEKGAETSKLRLQQDETTSVISISSSDDDEEDYKYTVGQNVYLMNRNKKGEKKGKIMKDYEDSQYEVKCEDGSVADVCKSRLRPHDEGGGETHEKNVDNEETVVIKPQQKAPSGDDDEVVQLPDMATAIEHANAMDKKFPTGIPAPPVLLSPDPEVFETLLELPDDLRTSLEEHSDLMEWVDTRELAIWMANLAIMEHYENAIRWCVREGPAALDDILGDEDVLKEFEDELVLKLFQTKRLCNDPDVKRAKEGEDFDVIVMKQSSSDSAYICTTDHWLGMNVLINWMTELKISDHHDKAAQWCKENGVISIDEIKQEQKDFADALGLPESLEVGSCFVASDEFKNWMEDLDLESYIDKARAWIEETEPESVDDIRANYEDFGRSLGLDPTEMKRLKADVKAPAVEEWISGGELESWCKECKITGKYKKAVEWCNENGIDSLAEIADNQEAFKKATDLKNLETKRISRTLSGIAVNAFLATEDLKNYMGPNGLKLTKYFEKAVQWCKDNNVSSVEGIQKKKKKFGEDIGLKRLELKRLETHVRKQRAAAAETVEMSSMTEVIAHARNEDETSPSGAQQSSSSAPADTVQMSSMSLRSLTEVTNKAGNKKKSSLSKVPAETGQVSSMTEVIEKERRSPAGARQSASSEPEPEKFSEKYNNPDIIYKTDDKVYMWDKENGREVAGRINAPYSGGEYQVKVSSDGSRRDTDRFHLRPRK